MKSIITTIGVCALLTGSSRLIAQDEPNKDQQTNTNQAPELKSQSTQTIKATVQKIDKDKREVTLKRDDGAVDTVKVPESARNFDQVKPGDVVTMKYTESVAVGIRKSDEPPTATGREEITRAPLGQKPAGQRTAKMQITASIQKIDRDKRELTLMGPEGNTRLVKVPEDMTKFDSLKEGDQVVITATESFAIEVSSPEKKSD
jgi:Cu/Ag efflux protein CusF